MTPKSAFQGFSWGKILFAFFRSQSCNIERLFLYQNASLCLPLC
jgi:hypothetical protein